MHTNEFKRYRSMIDIDTAEDSGRSDSDERYDDATEMPPEGYLESAKETLYERPSRTEININHYAGDAVIQNAPAIPKQEKRDEKAKDPVVFSDPVNEDFNEQRSTRCELCKYFYVIGNETLIVHANEPWPSDVKLFQPYEVEQILLPDNANCLAVQAFLKMCGLNFQIESRPNAEFMSPTGKVPFIKCGAFVVAELEGIVSFVAQKGISLTEHLEPDQKADMRAYIALINNVLGNAENYVCWCDRETYTEVTRPRNGSVYPWPLNWLQTWSKRSKQVKHLKTLGWAQKSLKEVFQEVETCCQALTARLENNTYFFGNKYTELDALLYGHIYTLLTFRLPAGCNSLALLVNKYDKLVSLIKKIDKEVMGKHTDFHIQGLAKVDRFSLFGKNRNNARLYKSDVIIRQAFDEPETSPSASTTTPVDTSDDIITDFSHRPETSVGDTKALQEKLGFHKDSEHTSQQCKDDILPYEEGIGDTGGRDGDWPTELDALLFGHLFTILTTPLPNSELATTVRKFPSLIDLVKKIEKDYFKRASSER